MKQLTDNYVYLERYADVGIMLEARKTSSCPTCRSSADLELATLGEFTLSVRFARNLAGFFNIHGRI
jgi:hypothetical protein